MLVIWTEKVLCVLGFPKILGKLEDYRASPEYTVMTLFLLYIHWIGSVVCGIGMNNAMNRPFYSHQTLLSTFPNKHSSASFIFKELNEPAFSNWTKWWMLYNCSLRLKCFIGFLYIRYTEKIGHTFTVCVHSWELLQCRTAPLGLSVAAFFSGRVSNR